MDENYLHKNKEKFQEILSLVEKESTFDIGYLELDYWRCFILRVLSFKFDVYFKGGSTLSTIFQITTRQSLDIDLLLVPKKRKDLSGNDLFIVATPQCTPTKRKSWFQNLLDNFAPLQQFGFQIQHPPKDSDQKCLTCACKIIIPKELSLKEGGITVLVDLVVELNEEQVCATYLPIIEKKKVDLGPYILPSAKVFVTHPFETLVEKVDAIQKRYKKKKIFSN